MPSIHAPSPVASVPPQSIMDEEIPPPFYSDNYGEMDLGQKGYGTNARIAKDGRIDVNINEKGTKLSSALKKALGPTEAGAPCAVSIPEFQPNVPRLNIVIQIIGSRGDVQPFLSLGRVLKKVYGHRVRLATHLVFKEFVLAHDLEFFSIGGDPAKLMAFMVKNPGLMPGFEAFRSGDIGQRRKEIAEILQGCWRSCFEAGDGTEDVGSRIHKNHKPEASDPFVADAIIANPPSFAHIHCAEKLGIPVHLMFTMPWSPTQAFPHPLVNIQTSNADTGAANFVSYALLEMLTWQGLGDIINRFRELDLGLEPISVMRGPGLMQRLRIPYTYCWSPSLLRKPKDWGDHIDIAGYYLLSAESDYSPPEDLAKFLAGGPPPIYIGFGSIVVDDPDEMTRVVIEAVKLSGQRALISQGWGGIGAEQLDVPPGVFMIGNCPHDWLFKRVSCVVHHGGAGTTAAGIIAGKPTVIVPFFGDQPFWGSIITKAGAGPPPIPHLQLTAKKLEEAIAYALEPTTVASAEELGASIREEIGTELGARYFHKHLNPDTLRCMLVPDRAAVWRIKRTRIRLSPFAVTTLSNAGILDLDDLKLYRPREYDTEPEPRDPVSGGAVALIDSIADFAIGLADFPAEILQAALKARQKPIKSKPFVRHHSKSKVTHSENMEVPNGAPNEAPSEVPNEVPKETPKENTSSSQGPSAVEPPAIGQPVMPHSAKKKGLKDPGTVVSHPPKIDMQTAIGTGIAASRLVNIGLAAPMYFTLGISKGFHNAPKLYGDKTVREVEKVTGFHSGLKAAGKELGYGFYDGISGLVTQPVEGAKEHGAAGVIKGIGRGIGGLVLKPGAGVFAVAGYTLNGVYKEVRKHFSSSVECYILASRSKQGYDEWINSSQEEKDAVMDKWTALGEDLRYKATHSPFAAELEAVSTVLFHPKNQPHRTDTTRVSAGETEIDELTPRNFHASFRRATFLLTKLRKRYKLDTPASDNRPGMGDGQMEPSTSDDSDNEAVEHALRSSIAEAHKAYVDGTERLKHPRLHILHQAIKTCVVGVKHTITEHTPKRKKEKKKNKMEEEPDEEEEQLPVREGLEAVTEYAIWHTLTDRMHAADQPQQAHHPG
ncbi:hypothetical protein FQN57_000113 [Myotisia sp. PD_48]|nr:hypothetical protein FQN57_000113 [Myotisia sp. PD_48]